MQTALMLSMAVVLAAAAVGFGVGQFRTLRWLKNASQLMPEDRRYFRWRAFRRLVGCVVMLVLAGLIGGLVFFGILDDLDQLIARAQAAEHEGDLRLTAEEEAMVRSAYLYVAGIALLLLFLLVLAAIDLMALRRYGMRQQRRLLEDRRAMLERQLPLLQRERQSRPPEANGEPDSLPL